MLSPVEVILQFCLNATYLTYLNEFYQHIFGTAMSSPESVILANIVMEDVENRVLSTYQSPPPFVATAPAPGSEVFSLEHRYRE